jgi:hypothetical protein
MKSKTKELVLDEVIEKIDERMKNECNSCPDNVEVDNCCNCKGYTDYEEACCAMVESRRELKSEIEQMKEKSEEKKRNDTGNG